MTHRFFHAFKWQTVVDVIKNKTNGIVLIVDGEEKILGKLTPEEKARTIYAGNIRDDNETMGILYAASKPGDKTWDEWINAYYATRYDENGVCNNPPSLFESLEKRNDALHLSCLVLLDHPNRSKNLHKILAETTLVVMSSTEKHVDIPEGTNSAGKQTCERIPDVRWLYGRPPLPDFDNLTDEMADLYERDGVHDLDSLIPVYDFSIQGFSFKQLIDAPLKERAPLVLLNGQPLLRAESITELFAWRGTGKTMFSLGLALHLAAGKSMPGLEISAPCKVLYVEGELPASQLASRVQQLSAGLEIPAGAFEVLGKSLQERGRGQAAVTIKTEAGRLAIEAQIERTGAEVLILDSIASLAQINTNNEEDWLPIIEWLVELRCKGLAVIYLQQSGKGGEQRGHSVSEDRIDLAIRLTATNSNPKGAAFKMTFTKEREGSLTPLSLHCTLGIWSIAPEKSAKPAKQPKAAKNADRDRLIREALGREVPQAEIVRTLKTSFSTVAKIKKETTE